MIYPTDFEKKTGMHEIRDMLRSRCLSALGRDRVDEMAFCADAHKINVWLQQTAEFRTIQDEAIDFPLEGIRDVRKGLGRIRLAGTHLEEGEVFDLGCALSCVERMTGFLADDRARDRFPALGWLADGVAVFPKTVELARRLLDEHGRMRDDASGELLRVRRELARAEERVSHVLRSILRQAQAGGVVERDVAPTLRDGRLVIPVATAMRHKIRGIVHDESASGKTAFVEPAEVVEANNHIRELEMEEQREIMRLLVEFTQSVRPHVEEMLHSLSLLAEIDFIQAKAVCARLTGAVEPRVEDKPVIDWVEAVHPLLRLSLEKQGKRVVPLDISLTPEQRLLVISGPNAGGKSVCLKTVGLLQYMVQCGLPVPLRPHSRIGVFSTIMMDMGDGQSIENDLSTYSSHLLCMKTMLKRGDEHTLLLIDEFGTGTEPLIGGSIAEAVLEQFRNRGLWGVITTHYQNLKRYADTHDGVMNAAMLYNRHEMKPLFRLSIGQPGSSFAIEMARKTGLPTEVIEEAGRIAGEDSIRSDRYLQDIARDKRYWADKRQRIHQREKDLEALIARYERERTDLESSRNRIINQAKEETNRLLQEANKKIENTIREIRQHQAEKKETRRIREELKSWQRAHNPTPDGPTPTLPYRGGKPTGERPHDGSTPSPIGEGRGGALGWAAGSAVCVKGITSTGTLMAVDGDTAVVAFGDMQARISINRLRPAPATPSKTNPMERRLQDYPPVNRITRETIDERLRDFRPEIDVRGMRGDEALNAVQYFIDDAILTGIGRVRILHGKGDGILRQIIRDYLSGIPNVKHFADEHIQFGGAGVTVVDL